MRCGRCLNAAIASLFIVASALVISDRIGVANASSNGRRHHLCRRLDPPTAASFAQLCAQTSAMTEVDPASQRAGAPRDSGPGCRMIRSGLRPSHTFPARCSSTSPLAVLDIRPREQEDRRWRPDLYGSTLFLLAISSAFTATAWRVGRFGQRAPRW